MKKLEITPACWFEVSVFTDYPNDVSINYIEHSSDHWHSDKETNIDITKEKAAEIIEFLQKAFDKENQQ